MSVNANVAKAVAEEGGIKILAGLARSMNRLVAEEAAGGLWNLSVGEEHKVLCYTTIQCFFSNPGTKAFLFAVLTTFSFKKLGCNS